MLDRLRAMPRPGMLWTMLWTSPDLTTEVGRAHERYRRLALTAGASAMARFTTIAASLVTVPLTLHYLGPERYGIWMVITSFNMMLGFADMGLGNGIVNAIAHEHGRNDRAQMRAIISSGYFALLGIAILLLLGFGAAYPFIAWNRLFNVRTAQAIAEAGPGLAVFAVCFAVVIPISLVQKVQIALQQGYSVGLWQCAGSVLSFAGLLLVVSVGGSLPWLVAALVGLPLVATMANSAWFFAGQGRDLVPSAHLVSWAAMRAPMRIGIQFFVLQLVASIAYGVDTMIVAQVAGADAVAQFSVPERMFAIIAVINTILMQPLWPAYREALSRGDKGWIRSTLKRSLTVSLLVSSSLSMLAIVAGPTLIRLWVGSAVIPSLLLLCGFGVWKIVEAFGTSIAFYMNGSGSLKLQIILSIISGACILILKIALVKRIGPGAIPWAASIGFMLFSGIPSIIYIRRNLA